jgi:alkanesulfonate monooxygenase SsuD/methylene tetrahydromethanopterin reductase-like flavin-dependent oxidoreductase (luciferase family)
MTASRSNVLNYEGKYHSYTDLDLCLHPYQAPYPPLWFPSSDKNSIYFTASHGYNTVVNTTSAEAKGLYEQYREIWVKHRDDPGRHNAHVAAPKLGKHHHIVVGDSEAEAHRLGEQAHEVWSGHIGYLGRKHRPAGQPPPQPGPQREASARVIAGTPASVTQELRDIVEASQCNYLILVFSFGDLRPEYALRSLELFARDVMPALVGVEVGS